MVGGLAIALIAVACGDDGGSDPATTDGDTEMSIDAGGDTEAVDILVPQAAPALAGAYLEGEPVELGAVVGMGPLVVTVEDITVEGANGLLSVRMATENPSANPQVGPDVYSVCTADGRFGGPTADSEIQSLETLEPGADTAGAAEMEAPEDCGEVVVQVRVLAVSPGGDHIAEYPVTG